MCAPASDSNSPVHDLSGVCCGLVPAIRRLLEASGGQGVDILVRRGMETELVNAFGCGGNWVFTLTPGLSADLARFVPAPAPADPLNLI